MEKLNYTRVLFTNDHNGHEGKNPTAILVYMQGYYSEGLMHSLEFRQLGVMHSGGRYDLILVDMAKLGVYFVQISTGRKSEYKEKEDYDKEYRVISGNY